MDQSAGARGVMRRVMPGEVSKIQTLKGLAGLVKAVWDFILRVIGGLQGFIEEKWEGKVT